MYLLNTITFLVCLATLTICIAVARRVHWQAGVLYLLVGLMPLEQIIFLVKEAFGWKFVIPTSLNGVGEFAVSMILLVAMLLVRKDAARQSNSEVRLRLSEALLSSDDGPVEKQLETDLRISRLSKRLNRTPCA
ncbi:MAG: hypothetical protein LLG20_26715 [Acidobacteriales bacterium]|nr:hypothetical protein [Terriglobales bacterium]